MAKEPREKECLRYVAHPRRRTEACRRWALRLPIVLMNHQLNSFPLLAGPVHAVIWLGLAAVNLVAATPAADKVSPLQILLTEAGPLTSATVSEWKQEGFKAVALILDERTDNSASSEMAR